MTLSAVLSSDAKGLKELGTEEFLKTYGKHAPHDVKEALQAATRAKLVRVSEGIGHQVEVALQLMQQALVDAEDGDGANAPPPPALSMALDALRVSAQLAYEVLAVTRETAPAPLAEAAQLLHTHALLALELAPAVQDAVARLCCAWWSAGAPDKEELLSQTLPFLLIRALTDTKGRACSVKPCLEMRHALGLLDFEDESIDDMKRLLLQASKSSLFLRRPEGRRFLAHVLTLHPSMVAEMALVMRNMVLTGKQWVLEAVGEIILRGWREATGPCTAAIEGTLIQGFAKACLHASSKGLAGNILAVLHQLHDARRAGPAAAGSGAGGALDGALARLYSPLLFRALSAANAAVRRNAIFLLLDVFPLVDPDASDSEQDAGLARQLAAVGDALADPAPAVRAAAAAGACGVLDAYWEIIPSATAAAFVAKLTDQLAFDASAPGVRVAVLEGLSLLVDNVHAQPVLRRALPGLAPLLSDGAPAVRVAMADLLLNLSTGRGIKFWEVVPLESLLEVMTQPPTPADDCLAARVHHLLVPSYLPNAQEGAARVAALLRNSPAAGRAFCRMLVAPLLSNGGGAGAAGGARVPVPLERIAELAAALASHLQDHPPIEDPHSPPRKSRARRTGGGGEAAGSSAATVARRGGGGAGGKRKKAAASDAGGGGGGGGDGSGGCGATQAEGKGGGEGCVAAVGAQDEAPEAWTSLLAGLAELAGGLSAALQQQLCGEGDLELVFKPGALQQLLGCCPGSEARAHVWRIAEQLPCLSAAAALRGGTLTALASGKLLEQYAAAPVAGQAPSSSGAAAAAAARSRLQACAELQSVLACLAAAPSCAKLPALLLHALGLPWCPAGAVPSSAAARGGAGAAEGREGGEAGSSGEDDDNDEDDDDEIVCQACSRGRPAHNLLMCDGCDAAYHTGCLRPRLAAVPEGDWFCPACDAEIRGSRLDAAGAIECLSLLLATEAGRQLLQQSGLLSAAMPVLQQRSSAAANAALSKATAGAGLVAGAHKAGKRGAAAQPAAPPLAPVSQTLSGCCEAVEAACLCARAAVHLSGLARLHTLVQSASRTHDGGGAQAEARAACEAAAMAAAAALAQAATDASSSLAAAADRLTAHRGGTSGSSSESSLAAQARRLACDAAEILTVLADARRMGLNPPGQEGHEEAASCGRAALAVLLAMQPCAIEGPARDLLKSITALLRLLLAPAADLDGCGIDAERQGGGAGWGEQAHAWALEWLSALCSGPLAGAAAAVRAHVPALLGSLIVGPPAAEGGAATDAVQPWLRPIVNAVACTAVAAAGGGGGGESPSSSSDGSSGDEEGACGEENRDPNAPAPRGAEGKSKAQGAPAAATAGTRAGGGRRQVGDTEPLEVPPLVAYLLQAAKLKKVEPELASLCLSASAAAASAREWCHSLGALRLARALGAPGRAAAGGDAGSVAALVEARVAAEAAAKGSGPGAAEARLLAAQISRLQAVTAAPTAGTRARR